MTIVSSLNKTLSFTKYVLSIDMLRYSKKSCRMQRYNIVASIEVLQQRYMKNYSKIFSFGEEGYSYSNISLSQSQMEPLLHKKITKALSIKKIRLKFFLCFFFLGCYYFCFCFFFCFFFHLKILISTGYVCFNRFIYSIYQFVLSVDIFAKF